VTRNRVGSPKGGRGITLHSPDLSAKRGWVVSTTPLSLYPRRRPGTHCTGGWVGHRDGLGVWETSRLSGIRSPDRPARSQSLYRMSYRAHTLHKIHLFKSLTFCTKCGQTGMLIITERSASSDLVTVRN
jgi:hypothetical protein